jgi:hypothetical protein
MSSDDHYYRQICVANTYYNAQTVLANASTVIYEFIPTGGDIFCNRNYPPGYMQLASPALLNAINQIINDPTNPEGILCFVLRDMGKTIYAATSNDTNATFAYFRMVQLNCPKPIRLLSIYNNQLGGPGGAVYGIRGAPATPDAYTNYTTFYIPVVIGGVGIAANTNAYQLAGGQM